MRNREALAEMGVVMPTDSEPGAIDPHLVMPIELGREMPGMRVPKIPFTQADFKEVSKRTSAKITPEFANEYKDIIKMTARHGDKKQAIIELALMHAFIDFIRESETYKKCLNQFRKSAADTIKKVEEVVSSESFVHGNERLEEMHSLVKEKMSHYQRKVNCYFPGKGKNNKGLGILKELGLLQARLNELDGSVSITMLKQVITHVDGEQELPLSADSYQEELKKLSKIILNFDERDDVKKFNARCDELKSNKTPLPPKVTETSPQGDLKKLHELTKEALAQIEELEQQLDEIVLDIDDKINSFNKIFKRYPADNKNINKFGNQCINSLEKLLKSVDSIRSKFADYYKDAANTDNATRFSRHQSCGQYAAELARVGAALRDFDESDEARSFARSCSAYDKTLTAKADSADSSKRRVSSPQSVPSIDKSDGQERKQKLVAMKQARQQQREQEKNTKEEELLLEQRKKELEVKIKQDSRLAEVMDRAKNDLRIVSLNSQMQLMSEALAVVKDPRSALSNQRSLLKDILERKNLTAPAQTVKMIAHYALYYALLKASDGLSYLGIRYVDCQLFNAIYAKSIRDVLRHYPWEFSNVEQLTEFVGSFTQKLSVPVSRVKAGSLSYLSEAQDFPVRDFSGLCLSQEVVNGFYQGNGEKRELNKAINLNKLKEQLKAHFLNMLVFSGLLMGDAEKSNAFFRAYELDIMHRAIISCMTQIGQILKKLHACAPELNKTLQEIFKKIDLPFYTSHQIRLAAPMHFDCFRYVSNKVGHEFYDEELAETRASTAGSSAFWTHYEIEPEQVQKIVRATAGACEQLCDALSSTAPQHRRGFVR